MLSTFLHTSWETWRVNVIYILTKPSCWHEVNAKTINSHLNMLPLNPATLEMLNISLMYI